QFDAFPFDQQQCLLCFAHDGLGEVKLIDASELPLDLKSISEWDLVGNTTHEEVREEMQAGKQTHRVLLHITLARCDFFWAFLIIIPTLLFCLISLIGAFFYAGEDNVMNAASIGLTTMTSLMLVVTILSDALDKSDNLPGLGWFVFVEIVVVCISVIILLLLDGARSVARGYSKKDKDNFLIRLLTSKRVFRVTRFTLFLLAITALGLNTIL
ncbi:hypothetical protein PENTCL1PPCAC_21479, partial [Pristionchus entomophagus]